MYVGKPLQESGYELTSKSLTIKSPPAGDFDLELVTAIKPQDNSLLEGLYKSGGNYCTQVGGVLQYGWCFGDLFSFIRVFGGISRDQKHQALTRLTEVAC